MSARPDVALLRTLAQIADNADALIGQKIRVYGKILAFDDANRWIVLWSGVHAVLVDASLIIEGGAHAARWPTEARGTVFVIGYVEHTHGCPPTFVPPAHMPLGEVIVADGVHLQAIVLRAEPHVDVHEWEAAVEHMAAVGALAAPR
ncbi:hypothetical protein K488DRAFT_89574 [Vararia minispora EC-137]|uniref:Uncharacterized protein n=1 Tax=Vararia minispora EC-137 TaxID=1314806 RepID=A0ACB8Q9W8_9AGAM|nr:hypothetical protein K488DRAFT_89574 [Vararia minispora EC-137]